jgi:hypothetical protein
VPISLSDAFDLRPLGEITLGGRSYPVPPLTFARFQKLLGMDHGAFVSRLVAIAETNGADLAGFLDLVMLVVPDMDRNDWMQYARPWNITDLILMLANGHDWQYIASAIDFGKPYEADDVQVGRPVVLAGLLTLSQQSGIAIDELMAKRVEGFYLIADGVKERNQQVQNGAGGASDEMLIGADPPEGLVVGKMTPERAAQWNERFATAEGETPVHG